MLTEYILWTYSVCIRYLVLAYHGQSAAGYVLFLFCFTEKKLEKNLQPKFGTITNFAIMYDDFLG